MILFKKHIFHREFLCKRHINMPLFDNAIKWILRIVSVTRLTDESVLSIVSKRVRLMFSLLQTFDT